MTSKKIWANSLLTSAFTMLFGFVNGVLLVRLVGVDERGRIAEVMLYAGLASILAQLGLYDSYNNVKRICGVKKEKFFYIIFFILTGVVSLVATFGLKFFGGGNDVYSYAVGFVSAVYLFSVGVARADRYLSIYNAIRVLAAFLPVLLLFFWGKLNIISVDSIIVSICISLFLPSVLCVIYTMKGPAAEIKINKSDIKKSFGMYLVQVASVLIISFDKFFIASTMSSASLAIYYVCFALSRIPGSLFDSGSSVIYSKSINGGGNLFSLLALVFRLVVVFSVPFFLLMLIFSERILDFIYGNDYSRGGIILSILSVESLIGGLSWFMMQPYVAEVNYRSILARQIFGFIPILVAVVICYQINFDALIFLAAAVLFSSVLRLVVTVKFLKDRGDLCNRDLIPRGDDVKSLFYVLKR